MGVVGAIMFILMEKAQWMTKAFGAGTNASYITALVFALLTLFLMFSIPRLSASIWSGISSSFSQSAATAAMVGGAATSVTIGTAGAAAQAAGSTIREGTGVAGILHRYSRTKDSGLSQSRRVLDAFRNRDSFAREGAVRGGSEKILSGLYQAGTTLRDLGQGMLMSQMPSSVQRAERAYRQFGIEREGQKTRRKEQEAVRDYVASRLGKDAASAMTFPEKWRLTQRVGQSREEAIQRAAEGYLRSRKVDDLQASLRQEAARLVGAEQAQALSIPKNFRLKPRRGQQAEEALREATLGLLRSQKNLDPSVKQTLGHLAIQREAVRILGRERAQKVVIPTDWAILPRKGQSPREALEGSTRALLQKQGLIDQKNENEIALRYRYALARKRRSGGSVGKKGTP